MLASDTRGFERLALHYSGLVEGHALIKAGLRKIPCAYASQHLAGLARQACMCVCMLAAQAKVNTH